VKGYPSCKINRRTYGTHNLIGLPYGTVCEVGRDGLIPLEDGEDLLPSAPEGFTAMDGVNKSDGAIGDGGGGGKLENDANDAAKKSAPENDSADNSNDKTSTTDNNNTKNGNINITRADNRNLVDDNTSQKLTHEHVTTLRSNASTPGSHIVAALISNSSTFESKTAFSQAKYVKRKQLKYQPRCRIVRMTPATLCSAMHLKDSKKISNLREDSLGQILSNANVCAGQRVMVVDDAVLGIVTSGVTRRMGGYGTVISLFTGQQPSYLDVVHRMNLSVGEKQCLKWVSLGEVFGDEEEKAKQTQSLRDEKTGDVMDIEKRDREQIVWPAPLQDHTRSFLTHQVTTERKIVEFMRKRAQRFTRKLTRHTILEMRALADSCREDAEKNFDETTMAVDDAEKKVDVSPSDNDTRQCDSLIIATKYDPTATLLRLLPYLAPSCPFVIYHEFLEPLLETFRTLQNYYGPDNENENEKGNINDDNENNGTTSGNSEEEKTKSPTTSMMQRRNIAINLRLTDTWFREYQVLEGRTHPNMSMSQNGGYLLMGTKLCPKTGTNELDDAKMKELRLKLGGRRKRDKGGGGGGGNKRKHGNNNGKKNDNKKRNKKK